MEYCKITTDETLRENIRHGSNIYPFAYYPENICQFDFCRIDWHWHHELEFLYVSEGSLLCLVGTDKIELSEGCALFINSGILHRFEGKNSAFIPNIVFSPALLADEKSLIYEKYIAPVINSFVPYLILEPRTEWQNHALEILSEIFALQEPDSQNELRTVRLLMQIWDMMFSHSDFSSGAPEFHRMSHKQARLQTMMQYIHDHYTEEISLDDIAASASISKSGALHIFKSGIHISPVAYLIQYRLAQAAEQLNATQKSVSSIAKETGFADSGYFCRKFRQHYNMSPNEYRHSFKISLKDCAQSSVMLLYKHPLSC